MPKEKPVISTTSLKVASTLTALRRASIPSPEVIEPIDREEIFSVSIETSPSTPRPAVKLKSASSKTGKSLTL